MENNGQRYEICGCGYKHRHIYDYKYLNEKQHFASCSCGISYSETHEWRFLTGTSRKIIKPTAKYCEKCGISVKL